MSRTPRSVALIRFPCLPARWQPACFLFVLTLLFLPSTVPAHADDALVSPSPANTVTAPSRTRTTRPLSNLHLASNATLPTFETYALSGNALNLTGTVRGGQLGGIVPNPFPVALRLGALLSPRTKFLGGIDLTLPKLSLGNGLETRIDAEAIVSANFGGVSTLIPLTINQVYSKGLIGGNRIYGGLGVGAYIGGVTRFGGKVFLGTDLATHFGLEVDVHFAGSGDPLVTALARLRL